MTETDPKQTEGPALPPLLSSLYFNLFLSHSPTNTTSSPPLPLSVSVSPCYVSLPYVVRPSSAFSPSPPPPPLLMSPPRLTWWMTLALAIRVPVGAPSLLCRNPRTAEWQSKFRPPPASESKRAHGRYQGDLYRMVTRRIRLSWSVMGKAVVCLCVLWSFPPPSKLLVPQLSQRDWDETRCVWFSFYLFSRLRRCCMKSKVKWEKKIKMENKMHKCGARLYNCLLCACNFHAFQYNILLQHAKMTPVLWHFNKKSRTGGIPWT